MEAGNRHTALTKWGLWLDLNINHGGPAKRQVPSLLGPVKLPVSAAPGPQLQVPNPMAAHSLCFLLSCLFNLLVCLFIVGGSGFHLWHNLAGLKNRPGSDLGAAFSGRNSTRVSRRTNMDGDVFGP